MSKPLDGKLTSQAKTRARLHILHRICQFSLPIKYGPYVSAYNTFTDNRNPPVGSLVAIQSSPVSSFYLSWVHDVKGDNYLLESIEDGTLTWWSNVGILVYEEKVVNDHPEWRWTDKQFEFSDRWKRACFKKRDAYITLPTGPDFHEDGSVTLGTRTRFGFDSHAPSRTFPDWRKVTQRMMLEFYDYAAETHKKTTAAKAPEEEVK